MKNKLVSLLLLSLFVFSSCGSNQGESSSSAEDSSDNKKPKTADIVVKERDVQYIDDFYRNYYQIFPISYADSDGDGNGDLQGMIDKFDYIKSLNVTGLWLTPVHPSPTYHKYDVMNYKAIDEVFGTLSDYDALVKKCHDNHMTIILDLVFNHSSSQHPWFIECMDAHINGETDNKYYNYYNVVTKPENGYKQYRNSGYYYEARFDSGMPDFNLQGVIDGTNTDLINDFKDIMRFWLVDHKVDGFRLDACTSFFTGNVQKNIQFLNWMEQTSEEIKPGSFIIGEVLESSAIYKQYYESDADAFFAFDDSNKYGNKIYMSILKKNVNNVNSFINADINNAKGHIPAPVLANHDIGRSTKSNVNINKMLHGLTAIANGATFEYYGEEIGMASTTTNVDQDHRQPMNWGDKYKCRPVPGSTSADDSRKYPMGSVADLEKDSNSMLNYFRKAYKVRLQNPELARGDCSVQFISESKECGILKRVYNNSTVYVALNLSNENYNELDISGLNASIVADLSTSEVPYYSNDTLVMPPLSMLILH